MVLALLYRYGALTRTQLERLTGLHYAALKRTLGHLVEGGYVLRSNDVAGWVSRSAGRPQMAYYLSLPLGAKTGAFALGIENDVMALKHYRRVRLPGTASHRLLANEYLILVSEHAGDNLDASETFSESCPDFPLFGAGVPASNRADTKYRFARIVSDGKWTLGGTIYLLECETGTDARKELVGKLSDYAGRWRRQLKPNRGERKFHSGDAPEPVILLTPSSEHKPMRDYLRKHLPDSPDWAAGDQAIREASNNQAEAGQLVIVAGIDEVRGDTLGRVYRPLYRYPEECSGPSPSGVSGWRVSLKDAGVISARIAVPDKSSIRKTKGAA